MSESTEKESSDWCRFGHPFVPGVSVDHAPGESDPRWCNICGETRFPPGKDSA